VERVVRWLRDVVVYGALLGRGAAVSLRDNWGIGILSLVLAVSLWIYVTDRENPEVSRRVPGAVPIEAVNVPQDQAVFSLSQESVTVTARASESVFDRLTPDDFRATIDLSSVTAQQAQVEVHVESEEPRAEVVEWSPARITVLLEPLTTRTVPVRAEGVGELPRGFEVAISVEPAEAQITGPERLVLDVEAVEADVNLTSVRASFQQTLPLQARSASGDIEGILIEPETAQVSVEVTQLEFPGNYVVRPSVVGVPAGGYNVTSIQVDPPFVTVTGSIESLLTIDAVQGLPTEDVTIDGATANVVRTVALLLPEGVTATRPDITVRVGISPTQGQLSFSIAPRVTNLGAGLSATLTPANVQVVLAGALPDLLTIQPPAIVATVDAAGLGPGDHTLPVQVQAPQGSLLMSVTPPQVRLTIR
jgi:YbbR domain-containing protein